MSLTGKAYSTIDGAHLWEYVKEHGDIADRYREQGHPDLSPFAGFLPGVVIQSNDFMYMHTSGDSPANVAPTGLEAAARAFARIIDEVNKLPLSALQRPLEARTPRIDFASCAAWIKDSSAACIENKERACAVTAPGC